MRHSLGRAAATVALACSALAVLAVVATAHTATFDSTVSIHFKRGHQAASDTFSGGVASTKVPCEHRTIKLLRRQDGGPNVLVGKDHTDKGGNWEIQLPTTPSGTYFARAPKRILRDTAVHQHVCSAAVSKDLKVKSKP